jgi:class 3 adenylate cyclase
VEIRSADGNQEGEPGAGRSRTTPTQAEPARTDIEPIRVRIGLHTGEAIKQDEDFFGKNVILAARVASQAKGGEILVSSLLKEITDSAGEVTFGGEREVELKGLSGTHRLFEVVWE